MVSVCCRSVWGRFGFGSETVTGRTKCLPFFNSRHPFHKCRINCIRSPLLHGEEVRFAHCLMFVDAVFRGPSPPQCSWTHCFVDLPNLSRIPFFVEPPMFSGPIFQCPPPTFPGPEVLADPHYLSRTPISVDTHPLSPTVICCRHLWCPPPKTKWTIKFPWTTVFADPPFSWTTFLSSPLQTCLAVQSAYASTTLANSTS